MALTIVSLNANGLRDQSGRSGLLQWLRSFPVLPDIVCLQETHCSSASECQAWFRASGFQATASPGSPHSCGCIILYRPTVSLVTSSSDSDGRQLTCEFSFCGQSFRVCCLYAPNRNPARNVFLDAISPNLDPSIPTILAGDFNTVFDRSLDRRGSDPSVVCRESTTALSSLFDSCCVLDIWRYLHPAASSYTWTRPDGLLASRIDIIGVPFAWAPSVSACDIIACPFSDHCAVVLSLSIPEVIPPGPGLWKLNTSILEDATYVDLVRNFWADWRQSLASFPSLAKWWDRGKSLLKGLTIKFCCDRSARQSQNRELLERLCAHLKDRVDSGLTSCVGPYHSTLAEIARLDLEKSRGAQIRARARWIEEGETSSAYFFRLEKKRATDRWISAIRNADGSIASSPADLCHSFSSFYSSLFTAEPTDPAAAHTLLANLTSVLPPDQAGHCDGPLSNSECFTALQGMAKRKAPGLDGLPAEFYLRFWPTIGPDLVAVLNSCYASVVLGLSQRRGVITLIFKKGDRLDPRNWCPITLLNVDYELAARVIAGRLLKVIHLVVSPDQTCGVPGRYIGENVAYLRDVA